jgi:hypothetical protein
MTDSSRLLPYMKDFGKFALLEESMRRVGDKVTIDRRG